MKKPKLITWINKHPKWSVFIALIILINYPWFYFGGPIEGRVVDQDGKPLEGVVAVLQFTVSGGSLVRKGGESRTIKGLEALTDENGVYRFGSWMTSKRPWWLRRSTYNPSIGFYKSGYKRSSILNERRKSNHWPLMYVSFESNKKLVRLNKYTSIEKQKTDWVPYGGIGSVAWGGVDEVDFRCPWEVFPLYILERKKVIEQLRKISTKSEYDLIGYSNIDSKRSVLFCSTPSDFFKKFQG